jgi:hypothetical protein
LGPRHISFSEAANCAGQTQNWNAVSPVSRQGCDFRLFASAVQASLGLKTCDRTCLRPVTSTEILLSVMMALREEPSVGRGHRLEIFICPLNKPRSLMKAIQMGFIT